MCAGPLKPPSKPKPPPAPAPVPEPEPVKTGGEADGREAELARRQRALRAFDSTILTGAAGLTGDAPVRKKRLLGE